MPWTAAPLSPDVPFGLALTHDAHFPSLRVAAVGTADFRAALQTAFWNASDGLVVVRGLHGLSAEALTTALSALGALEAAPADGTYEVVHPSSPLLHEFSKVPSSRVFDADGVDDDNASVTYNAATGRPSWHTDQSFRVPAIAGSAMFCLATPPGGAGATLYAGTVASYAALDASTRADIDGLRAVHAYASLATSFARFSGRPSGLSAERLATLPEVDQPIVMHAGSRPSLYLAPHAMARVHGWPVERAAEGERLIARLAQHATQPEFVYRHVWRAGDLVVWDNRRTMHAATRLDDAIAHERVMWRATFNEHRAAEGVDEGGAPADCSERVS